LQFEDFFKPEVKELDFDDLFCFDGCESEKDGLAGFSDLQAMGDQSTVGFSGMPNVNHMGNNNAAGFSGIPNVNHMGNNNAVGFSGIPNVNHIGNNNAVGFSGIPNVNHMGNNNAVGFSGIPNVNHMGNNNAAGLPDANHIGCGIQNNTGLSNLYNTVGNFSTTQYMSEPTIDDLLRTNYQPDQFQNFTQDQYYCPEKENQRFNDQLLSSFAQPDSFPEKIVQQETKFWEDLFATPKYTVKNRKKLDNESETDVDIKITRHEVDELFLEAEELEEPIVLEEVDWIGRKEDGFSVTQIETLKEQLAQSFQLIVQGYCIEKQLNHTKKTAAKFWADELVYIFNLGSIW
jgi:hypothetical protein